MRLSYQTELNPPCEKSPFSQKTFAKRTFQEFQLSVETSPSLPCRVLLMWCRKIVYPLSCIRNGSQQVREAAVADSHIFEEHDAGKIL